MCTLYLAISKTVLILFGLPSLSVPSPWHKREPLFSVREKTNHMTRCNVTYKCFTHVVTYDSLVYATYPMRITMPQPPCAKHNCRTLAEHDGKGQTAAQTHTHSLSLTHTNTLTHARALTRTHTHTQPPCAKHNCRTLHDGKG